MSRTAEVIRIPEFELIPRLDGHFLLYRLYSFGLFIRRGKWEGGEEMKATIQKKRRKKKRGPSLLSSHERRKERTRKKRKGKLFELIVAE